jgi:hypothetical protein
MVRVLIVLAAFAVLGAAAVAHGLRTDRWGESADLRAAADRMAQIPARVGDWDSEPFTLDPRQVEAAQVAGVFSRRYTHRYAGETVTVMILCGRPGPVAVHPPEVCYGGAGYTPGVPRKHPLAGGGGLWVADFTKDGPRPEVLRISWAWSPGGGELVAADAPRTDFAGSKLLYKVYLIRSIAGKDPAAAGTPELELLAALMPELRTYLAPAT